MTYAQFISLVRGEAHAPEAMEKLQAFLQENPWCQTARLISVQALGSSAISASEKKLAAVYAGDRRRLQQLLENGGRIGVFRQEEKAVAPSLQLAGDAGPAAESVFRADPRESVFAATPGTTIFQAETTGSIFSADAEPVPVAAAPAPVPEPQTFQSSTDDPHEVIRRRLEEIF